MKLNKSRVLAGVVGLGVLGALGGSTAALANHAGASGHPATESLTAAQTAGGVSAVPGLAGGLTRPGMAEPGGGYGQGVGHVRVVLRDVNGKSAGQVDIYAQGHGENRVSVRAWGLTPGFHGFHIHAIGVCDPTGAKPFASAGGHFNPTGSPEGMQAGAFPVLLAGANGQAQADFLDPNFRIADLSGAMGSAIVIHALPDNYANIPNRYAAGGVAGPDMETQMTGDGGSRVACGVVAKPRAGATAAPSPQPSPSAPTVTGPHY
ncbi:MAG TPA: superoxide dismutase family protein [Rugosimonospora sp.]|nr:superoxide dismutase family protein [Rugosimonospora sp.]